MIEEDDTPPKKKVEVVKGDIIDDKPAPTPTIKPKRRDKTLSNWDYRETMKNYIKGYRSEGKDSETGNKYVKKYKSNQGA